MTMGEPQMNNLIKKRYQVFISSTYEDLKPERESILRTLLEMGCIPSGMELFPAKSEDQWTHIKRVIEECDYYVVIVAGMYGSVDSAGMSYTEKEYRYAVELGKPVFGFLHEAPGDLPSKYTERRPETQDRLEIFRSLVKNRLCRFWRTPSDLASKLGTSLLQAFSDTPGVGWVRDPRGTLQQNGEVVTPILPNHSPELSIHLIEDKVPTDPNGLVWEQIQYYLWDDGETDVLWLKLVLRPQSNIETLPDIALTISSRDVELRDTSHMYFACDAALRSYQMPDLSSFRNSGTISHVFYRADRCTEEDHLKKAIPVPVTITPVRARIFGPNRGMFRICLCDFLTYGPAVPFKLNGAPLAAWLTCRLPKVLATGPSQLDFSFRFNAPVLDFRFQVALPWDLVPDHPACSHSQKLSHPWLSYNPFINYPGMTPLMSTDGRSRYVPIFLSHGEQLKECNGRLVYGCRKNTIKQS